MIDGFSLCRANCLCRIFTDMGEAFLFHCIHNPQSELGDLSIFNILLDCTAHPEKDISDITFSVWYQLSDELYKADKDDLNQLFQPYIKRLVDILCTQCQYDEDNVSV